MLSGGTFTVEQAANDAMGDGDKRSCEEIVFFFKANKTVKTVVAFVVLTIIGVLSGYAAWFAYNTVKRIKAKEAKENLAKGAGAGWENKEKADNEMM